MRMISTAAVAGSVLAVGLFAPAAASAAAQPHYCLQYRPYCAPYHGGYAPSHHRGDHDDFHHGYFHHGRGYGDRW